MTKEKLSDLHLAQALDTLPGKEEKLQALLQVLPVGVSVLGEDRKPIFTNSTLQRVLGIPDEKLRKAEYEQREITITLSMGLASMPGDDVLALDTLLNRADQALYMAKEKGRNQISVWQEVK